MALYLCTNLSTATNPALTPVPFDSVTEADASVNVAYNATGGYGSTPGMMVDWTGAPPTGLVGYGRVNLTTKNAPTIDDAKRNRPSQLRVSFMFKQPTVTGFATNNEVKVFRVLTGDPAAPTELCSITWIKTASNYKWKLTESITNTSVTGSNFDPKDPSTGLSNFAYTNDYFWEVDIVTVAGVAFMHIGPCWPYGHSNTTGANVNIKFPLNKQIPMWTVVDIGAVSGNIAAPSAASRFMFDHIRIEDNLMENPGFAKGRDVNTGLVTERNVNVGGNLPIDNGQVGLDFGQFCEFGTVDTDTLQPYRVHPTVQIAVEPGAVYEISMTAAEPVVGASDSLGQIEGRGYTQIQGHAHHSEETAWESPPYYGMFQTICRSAYVVMLEGQNAIRLYNGEFVKAEFYIRRIRFL